MPVVTRLMERMSKEKRLPKLPKDIVKPTIVTGVEALGRGNDLQKLDYLQELIKSLVLKQLQNMLMYLTTSKEEQQH